MPAGAHEDFVLYMNRSKIRLSPNELALVQDAQIILTKNSVLQKTAALMQEVQARLQAHTAASPHPIYQTPPKISRGENYCGLPWVVLDFPRISDGEGICFVRSFFWWGKFFSSTLQLSGRYQTNALPRLQQAQTALANRNYFIGVSADPWQHHFEADNYQPIATLTQQAFARALAAQPHTKIAARWPLNDWDAAANVLEESWQYLTGLVT